MQPIKIMMVIACSAAGLSTAALANSATSREPLRGPDVVHCYDEARDAVTRVLVTECRGTVVSDDRAAVLRERRTQAVQRALKGQEQPIYADKRMTKIGTGFFVSDGRLITNKHVIEGCAALSVETTTGQVGSANLLHVDENQDLALVQANTSTPATAVFQARESVQPGGVIALIGYPDQGLPPRKPLMAMGTTVPLDVHPNRDRIAIKADVRRGNSGGPLLDQWGNVVGVINAKINTVKVYNETKQLIRDVGFAISTPAVLRFLDRTDTPYRLSAVSTTLNPNQLFERAKPFVARIGCWS
jgi:serine protease Do